MAQPARLDLLLIGFGNVARRFVRLLHERETVLLRDHLLSCRVVGIATRRHGTVFSKEGIAAGTALEAVARDAKLDASTELRSPEATGTVQFIEHVCRELRGGLVVVETTPLDIERGQPAIDHVRAGLSAGAHVITANKGPAAFACHELTALANAARRAFLFEGAVMDGVPVFNLVRETLPGVEIIGFRGVLNSTTNYILSAMEEGREFQEALSDMQSEGIAEADASLDIDGWDTAAKASVVANALMAGRLTPLDVDRTGIRHLTGTDVREAVRLGRRIRLVASGERLHDRVNARVDPIELDGSDPLAQLRGTQNALVLRTDLMGEIAVTELTAGLTQTAYALLSDLITIRRKFLGVRS